GLVRKRQILGVSGRHPRDVAVCPEPRLRECRTARRQIDADECSRIRARPLEMIGPHADADLTDIASAALVKFRKRGDVRFERISRTRLSVELFFQSRTRRVDLPARARLPELAYGRLAGLL